MSRAEDAPIALTRIWPGFSARHTLLIPIPARAWAPPATSLRLAGTDFVPKRELHVTLLGSALSAHVIAAVDTGRLDPRFLRQAYADCDWTLARTQDWLHIATNKHAGTGIRRVESIIERIELPALARYVAALSAELGECLEAPPPHVTLYTAGDARGIGIPDGAALERMTITHLARQ